MYCKEQLNHPSL